jgi:multidrug efflux pump
MVTATVLAVFFVPVFFVAVLRLFRVKPAVKHDDSPIAVKAAT